MQLLKQSTTVTIQMGPALDKTDGVTEETALSPTVEISKNNAVYAARNSATAIAHDANGWYRVELNTTDTNTLGRLIAKFDDAATHLPVWHEFTIVPADVYDSLVSGTGNGVRTNVIAVNGTAQTAGDINGKIGTPSNLGGGATLSFNLSDIEAQTDDIGAAGAGLTAIPWNASWDAEVESEVNDALVVHRLDELLNADSDIDGLAPPTVGSVFFELLTKTTGSFT